MVDTAASYFKQLKEVIAGTADPPPGLLRDKAACHRSGGSSPGSTAMVQCEVHHDAVKRACQARSKR